MVRRTLYGVSSLRSHVKLIVRKRIHSRCTSPSKPRCPANSLASRRRAKRPRTAFLGGDRHEQLRRVTSSLLRNIHTTLFGGRGRQNSLCERCIVNKDCSTKSDRQTHGYGCSSPQSVWRPSCQRFRTDVRRARVRAQGGTLPDRQPHRQRVRGESAQRRGF